jgi:3-oxoacyl-[acyl-carrier-protein] synthase-3
LIFKKTRIKSLEHVLPDKIISSQEIEGALASHYERLKLSPGRLEIMTGIKNRRYWERGTSPAQMASLAGKRALTEGRIDPQEIDLLIFSSVCRDFLEPASASIVHQMLKLPPTCQFFDLSNACLGFVNSMVLAANLIEQEAIKSALIVSGENSGPLFFETLDYLQKSPQVGRKEIKKLFANFTIGSGAVAMVLAHESYCPEGLQLKGAGMLADSNANHLCRGGGDTHSLTMETQSEKLMEAGIKLAIKTWEKTKETLQWSNQTPDWVIAHQVGKAHEQALLKSLHLEDKKTFATYTNLGNTGSVALPLTLSMLLKKQLVRPGEKMALLGIGSGLSSQMLGIEC